MARRTDRVIAWFFAGIFLISISALTIAVIISMMQSGSDSSQQSSTKEANIKDRLKGTKLANFTPVDKVDSLQAQDTVTGTGKEAKAGDRVRVDYTGALAATGEIFESSKDSGQTVSFLLNEVIAGWSQGIPGMKEGGTRRLLIPAELAYGDNPQPGSPIPPGAALVFDVTLHKVEK